MRNCSRQSEAFCVVVHQVVEFCADEELGTRGGGHEEGVTEDLGPVASDILEMVESLVGCGRAGLLFGLEWGGGRL